MKSIIVAVTRETDPTKTILYESLKSLKERGVKFSAHFYTQNTQGLSQVYNRAISELVDYDCIVFVHDDVYIDDAFIFDKIEDGFQEYDIVGVAGGLDPVIKAPALWHLMTKRENWKGAVAHFNPDMKQIGVTSFGPMPAVVTILDGVFLAVNRLKCTKAGWKFNENYTFHHYDVASTLDATRKGLVCGVLPIHIIHKSPGLGDINDTTFVENQRRFLNEYQL